MFVNKTVEKELKILHTTSYDGLHWYIVLKRWRGWRVTGSRPDWTTPVTSNMTQRLKVLATKSNNLSSVPRTDFSKLSSELHTCVLACMHAVHTHIHTHK